MYENHLIPSVGIEKDEHECPVCEWTGGEKDGNHVCIDRHCQFQYYDESSNFNINKEQNEETNLNTPGDYSMPERRSAKAKNIITS